MHSKSSTTTKFYRFGNIFIRICMILSIVLSNMAIQTTQVFANSGKAVSQDEGISQPDWEKTVERVEKVEEQFSPSEEDQVDLGKPDVSNHANTLVTGTDVLNGNAQFQRIEFNEISESYINQDHTITQEISSKDSIEEIKPVEDGKFGKYLYDEIPGFTMVYFDNMYLTPPAFSHHSGEAINYDWFGGSPDGLPADKFSIRWYGQFINTEITDAEEFTFTANSDDGVRLQINGTTIINSWPPDWQGIYSGTYTIEPGVPYDFVLEYFEDGGDAHIQLDMVSDTIAQRYVDESDFIQVDLSGIQTQFTNSKTGALADGSDSVTIGIELLDESNQPISDNVYINVIGTDVFVDGAEVDETNWILIDESNTDGLYEFDLSSWEPEEKSIQVRVGNFPLEEIYYYEFSIADINSGLLGEYFNNMTLEDPSYTTLNNQVIDYDWGNSAPMDGMPADAFSVRWTGYVIPDYTETYTFTTYSDDGMRLWIDGTLLINGWFDQGPTEYSDDIDMIAGEEYEIIVEYYENGGGAVAALKWESPSLTQEVIRRNNLFMPWFDIYNYEIDVSETEVINDGVDSTQISVQLTNYIDLPLSGEDVLVQISGEDNSINGVLLEDEEWVSLTENGTTGQYDGELTSTTAGIKYIRFKIRDLLLDDEYPVRFMEEEIVYPDCVISTIIDGEAESVQLIVEEDTSCKLIPGIYDFDYVNIAGTLYLESDNTYDEATEQYSSNYVEINADYFVVAETGHVSADGLGYISGDGPGAPQDGDDENTPGGGGYGGYGGDGDMAGGDPYYGNMIDPGDSELYAGSGGGGPYGGAGGGIISIVANYLYNDGEISADGKNGSNYSSNFYSGGGSGGSIYIYAVDMELDGLMSANGGDAAEDCSDKICGGGGSGGRILILTDSVYSSLESNIHSIGGIGNVSNQSGASGTVLFDQISSDDGDKFLYVRNNNQNGKFTTIEPDVFNEIDRISTYERGKIQISHTNHLGEEVTCEPWSELFDGDKTGEFYLNCDIETDDNYIYWGRNADVTINSDTVSINEFNVQGNVTIKVPSDGGTYSIGYIDISQDGNLSYLLDPEQDFTMDPDGLNIDEGGSLNIPNNGGQITVEIFDNEFNIDGTLSVNGTTGNDGGNLVLLTDYLYGSGMIQANGDSGENPGNGGTIELAIESTYYFSGQVQAYGGEYGEYAGNPGIIFDQINNNLTVDNNDNSGTYSFPEGTYTFNRIDIGNAVEVVFAGEGTQLTINDGVYGTGTTTPILTVEGSLNDPESFEVNNVIINWIGYADFDYSVDIAKPEIMRNGVDSTTINFDLTDLEGNPLSREDVYIRVSGDGNLIDGVAVDDNTWVNITESATTGTYITELASTVLGTKNIQFKVGNRLFETVYTVDCVEVTYIQILLDGETADPDEANGKTGDIKPIYTGDPTHINFRVVDGEFVLQDTVNGTAAITLDDSGAQYPQSINISNGIGEAYIIWSAIGEQSITVSGEGDLSSITGNETTTAINSLTIADGETYYMDEVRTYLTSDVSSGQNTITVADATGLYPGHRILLLKMTGDDAGENELFTVVSVTGNQIELATSTTFSYLTSSGVTQVLLIPRIENITVQSGGVLTVNDWDGNTGGALYLDLNNITINDGGQIHADAKGYEAEEGPGAGLSYAAGGYGGEGASNIYPATTGKIYGDAFAPLLLGSGGGKFTSSGFVRAGGNGGGIVRINAQTINNDGILSSIGGQGSYNNNGYSAAGGSGGSIWISATNITGIGIIHALGGDSGPGWLVGSYNGFAGGGGRIAIEVINDGFGGSVNAYSGQGYSGAAGTVYWVETNELIIDNNGLGSGVYTTGLISGDYNFDAIELINNGNLTIYGEDSTFDMSGGKLTGDGSVNLVSEGELIANGPLTVSGYSLDVQGKLTGVTDFVISGGETVDLYRNTPVYEGAYTFNNLEIAANATLNLNITDDEDGNYENDFPFEIISTNVSIAETGIIVLDGMGYISTSSIGNGPGGGWGSSESGIYGVGGSHGGRAADSPTGTASAEPYGDELAPVYYGSAGGQGYSYTGGNGGGALHLSISNLLDLDGVISANGINASENAGGGAGGSIWVEAAEVDGNGSLLAAGGVSSASSGGGGGRVSIITDVIDPDIAVNVIGGAGVNESEHGTAYFGPIDFTNSSIIADPPEVAIGGVAASDVLVTLYATNGHVLPYKDIEVTLVSGSTAFLNGDPILLNQTVTLSETDLSGELHFDVSATTYGMREFVVSVDGGELTNHVVIDFTAGDFEPANSTLVSEPQNVPADGVSTAAITATANNIDNLPIIDVDINLSADGDAILTQPTDPTDEYGQTVGYVADATIENVTVSADAWGIPFLNSTVVNFYGTDFVSNLNVPTRVTPGEDISIGINIDNLESYAVEDVLVELTLPDLLTYSSDTSSVTPVINGQVYSWTIAEMAANEDISFTVQCSVSASAIDGDTMELSLVSDSAVTEINPTNNTATKTVNVVLGYSFDSSITPDDTSLYIGGEVLYTIQVKNTDILPDLYTISVTGLDTFDTELSTTELAVTSGASKKATLKVGTDSCISDPLVNFTVLVTSSESGIVQEIPATVTLDSSPQIILDAPENNAISGSQSVLFSWRTDPETTGTLTIYPTDDPAAVQTYTSESGMNHAIQVENLTRNTSYTWQVDVVSACGSNTSVERVLNIGNGIVFSNHNQDIAINRDYDQRINVVVQNTDSIAHTLTSSVINPYEDLIVNFVDSGSVDQTITLEPGETVNLTLAVHAQDAVLHEYTLTANLIADEDTTPIIDNANLNVDVLFEGDYTIEEVVSEFDPLTLARTYEITNHGQTITDLALEAIDPNTGLPASIYLTPSLDHAMLKTGESIRVVAYPIFNEEDAANHIAYAPTLHMAKASSDSVSDIPFELHVKGAGVNTIISGVATCGEGRDIYTVTITECELGFATSDWYCTNRTRISTPFNVPAFLKKEVVSGVSVDMTFSPQHGAKDHDGVIYFNGTQVIEFENLSPEGTYSFDVPTELWNESMAGIVTQNLSLVSHHPNAGHYVVTTGYQVNVDVNNAKTFACAASEVEAEQAIESMYPCSGTATFDPEKDVYEKSVWALGEIKSLIKSINEAPNIPASVSICTQGFCADPIDSRTGVFSFATPDISFPTSAGTLAFQRAYSTGAVEQYSEVGYGWIHNHSERIIFPDSMYGMEDYMIFRDHLGNQHLFKIEEDGTFTPGPGVLATLEAVTDGYTVTASDGHVFTFNSSGMITSLADSQGNAFIYTYDEEGVLQRVSADNGTRYIDFTYNEDIRIEAVTDYTGREVSFEYDEDGNLIRSTDLLDQEWTYEYDENHRMTALNDPTGLETVRTEYDMLGRAFKQYDADGKLLAKIIYHNDGSITIVDADGNSETHSYDSRGIMIDETDQVARDTNTNYDANFRPTTITNEIGSELTMEWSEDGKQLLAEIDPAGNRTEYTYDENGNLTSTTDPSGNTKSYIYDGELLTSTTDIEGKTTTYTYTAEGWLESQTDAYDRTTTYTYDEHGQRLTTTDWLGETTSNVYDELGRQIESVDAQGRVNRNEYNVAGQLLRSIRNYDAARPQNDENMYNLTTTYTYDVYGNQETVTDPLGHVTTYDYDSNGRLVSTIDALDNETTNTYDANGQLITSTDALGHSTTYVYDAAGRRLSTVNALGISSGTTTFDLTNNASTASDSAGNAATYYYNELNQVVRIVDPMGHETTTTYNANGNVETKTDELGRTTTYTYDELNRLVLTTDASGATTQTVYDEDGYRSATIDALGNETTYTYDDMGRVIATTDALGHTTSSVYDEDGKLTSTTDAMGRTTSYTYDEWDRKASMTDGAGRTSTYTYDVLDRVISMTGTIGTSTTTYDALGRTVSRTDVYGHTTTTTYDDLGRVKTTTDYQGNITTNYYDQVGNVISSKLNDDITSYDYDVLNRQIAVTDPLGNTTQTVYDDLGNVSDTINAKGIVTHYIYDSLQRNVAIIQNYMPGEEANADTNVRVDYTYNAVGNRIYVNDANGHVTEFQYDANNQVTRKIDPIGNTWDYVYDLAGNLTSKTDGNGVVTGFVYDDGGNLLTIDYPDGEADVSFTYNNAGQRVTMTDGIGTTTWTYDERSRLVSVNDAYGSELTYTYNEDGQRTGLEYADGKQVAYTYDNDNHLAEVASWDSQDTEYDYDALGQLTSMLRPNGVESSFVYDDLGRLTELDHSNDLTSLANYTYTYDAVGNIIHAEENVMGGGASGPTVLIMVMDTTGEALAEKTVYAYNGETYSNYSKVTDELGQVSITLPEGVYRFRVDVDGTEFWSGETDHCQIGNCGQVTMTIPQAVLVTVTDSNSNVLEGQTVYAYEGETYSSYQGVTDELGQVALRLPQGDYRFRTDLNGTRFWSAEIDGEMCTVPGCTVAEILVTVPLVVTVQNDLGDPMADLTVYAYDGETYSNISAVSDENGQVELTLPEGEYHFRANYNNVEFWSAAENHCAIPGCSEAAITVSLPVTVTVLDTAGNLISDVNVYAFDGTTYQNFSKKSDANGEVVFTLPGGDYRFRADYNSTQFWSGTENTCAIPGCTTDAVTVTQPVTVTVLDTNGLPQENLNVYAYTGSTYTSYSKQTNSDGEAVFTLPQADYRFRADLNGIQFWSSASNDCSLPECSASQVTVTIPLQVVVHDGLGDGIEAVNVYAFTGTTYSGISKTTDADGLATFTLPQGDYRFRADVDGEQIFSDEGNHCEVPGCELVSIAVGIEPTPTATAAPTQTFTNTPTPLTTPTETYTPTPLVADTNTPTAIIETTVVPEDTNTPLPADTNTPEPLDTNTPEPEHTATPTVENTEVGMYIHFGRFLAKLRLAPLADDTGVSVTVLDTDGTAQSGLTVYAFDGTIYSGQSAVTNESGLAAFTLAQGNYRFRADLNGTQFWSGTENTCSTPACTSDDITVTKPITVTVLDSDSSAQSGLNVYAFNGTTYAGYSKVTSESGEAVFTLPQGEYRFRADLNGTQFWSAAENNCALPGCEASSVTVSKPLTVTVRNSDGTVQSGLNVYAFDGTTYKNFSKVTNESGEAVFTLPEGDYRFRADLNGTQFWSSAANDCTLPGCEALDVSVTVPLTVSVVDSAGIAQTGIAVYAFNGDTYMNFSKTTNEVGQAVFTMPEGDYRFRADAGGTHYWSSESNDCTLPGCTTVTVSTSKPVSVTVVDSDGTPQVGLSVYAFDGTTYSVYSKVTDENGAASFYLPMGDYRFRADSGGTQYWSSEENACTIPGCESVIISVTLPVTISVVDTDGTVQEGISVYAFDDETYSNYSKVTDENGVAVFNLPVGDYRFRADLNGTQFWSAEENSCALPGCITDSVTVTKPVTVTVAGEEGNPYVEVTVYAFDGETYAGYSAVTDAGGQVVFTLPQGDYHFRADYDGVQFWSNNENSCTIPGCEEDAVTLPGGTGEQEVSIDYTYDALNRLI
ncbi:MAG: hypothetical protein JEZ00_11440, partial [Anaerolineaceae bacterium]|nr:hypothetical protein [Anaerolineaceae bacterium]